MAPTTKSTSGVRASTRQCKRPQRYEVGGPSRVTQAETKPKANLFRPSAEQENKVQAHLLEQDFPHLAPRTKTSKTASKSFSPSAPNSNDGAPGRAPCEKRSAKKRIVIIKRSGGDKTPVAPSEVKCIVKTCTACADNKEICVEDECPNCDCTYCMSCRCEGCAAFHRKIKEEAELHRLWSEAGPGSEAYQRQCLKVMNDKMASEEWLRKACRRKARREGWSMGDFESMPYRCVRDEPGSSLPLTQWTQREIEAAEALIMMSRS